MQLTDQVIARNTLNQHVVLSSDAKGTDFIEWHAAGDGNGNDVQYVSPEIARGAAFRRLVNKGIVEITDENAPEVVAAFGNQAAAWHQRSAATSQAAQASIEHVQQNDTIALECVGPDSRGTGPCGVPVPVKEKTKNDKPPLCTQHAGLAPQFIPEQQQVGTEIKTVWLRPTMTARATA